MKRLICLMLFAALIVTVLPAFAGRTFSGRAGTDTYRIMDGSGGQLVLTLHWKTRSALLFLAGSCDDGASFVSGSMEDRFQRVEIGVDPGTTCEIQIIQRSSNSTKYWLNIQGTGEFRARTPDIEVKRIRGRRNLEAPPLDSGAEGGIRSKSR